MIPWVEWMQTFVGDDSWADICAKIGCSESTFRRWRALEQPPCSVIIDLSVAYGADVLVGLVTSGYITRAYVEAGVEDRLTHVPTIYMTNELARRAARERIVPAVRPEWE